MIQVNVSQATSFLDEDRLKSAEEKAASSLNQVQQAAGPGAEWLGWRRILAQPNDAELEQMDTLATNLRAEVDVLIICGIGGSYLGAKALIEALTHSFNAKNEVEVIFAGHQMSGRYMHDLIEYLEQDSTEGTPKQVAVNVISKSGTTLETALSFRILRQWMHRRFPDVAKDRIICTTGGSGGVLNKLAERYGYRKFIIPEDIGGRYSVLSPVGLFPAAMAGIDIRTLFYGALSMYEKLEQNADELLRYAAVRYAFEQQGKAVDLFCSFEPDLHGLCQWLQQLLGESEGKQGRGLFPVTAQYSTDLHSLGQFMQQGTRNMIETFITVEGVNTSITVEKTEANTDQLNYLGGQTFHQINQKALSATRAAHVEGNVPCVSLSLKENNAQNIGEFIYFFELFTAVYCYMLEVNPFNQPGVENYKKEMYQLLGKK